jgi:hypothetical protein
MGNDQALVNKLKSDFMHKWECHNLGNVKEFLCMHIVRKNSSIYLDQTVYLSKVLQCFGQTNAKYANTPLPEEYHPAQ